MRVHYALPICCGRPASTLHERLGRVLAVLCQHCGRRYPVVKAGTEAEARVWFGIMDDPYTETR